ncbi:MAG: phosphotyrosine protein phosphatase [Methylomonas sp.]|nr:MAG: phosphotyrosine protein phosphatase [Methylomonas sp.]
MKSLSSILNHINSKYGTYRGLIRLLLAQAYQFYGGLDDLQKIDMQKVERFVFVCLGNICRSPYAELIAHEKGLPAVSVGLSTTSGLPAYNDAINAARINLRDLTNHITTNFSDFHLRDSDLLLVMEVRQIKQLRSRIGDSNAQISLLGLWSKPSRPHIHDPMTLNDAYFLNCYSVIENSVTNLAKSYYASKTKID